MTMSAAEAVRTLAVAGRSAEVRDLIAEADATLERRYSAIRADTGTTEDVKRSALAKTYSAGRSKLATQLDELATKVKRTDHGDARRAFGIEGLPGDAASLTIAARDASDRVARAEPPELADLLSRATRTGDETLARAGAQRGLDDLNDKLVNAFLADRPELDAAVQRLWDAQHAAGAESFILTASAVGLRPEELSGMHTDDIELLAEDATVGDQFGARTPFSPR